jgi:hypothetical protein
MSDMVIDLCRASRAIIFAYHERRRNIDKWKKLYDEASLYDDLGEEGEVTENWEHLGGLLTELAETEGRIGELASHLTAFKMHGSYTKAKEMKGEVVSEDEFYG